MNFDNRMLHKSSAAHRCSHITAFATLCWGVLLVAQAPPAPPMARREAKPGDAPRPQTNLVLVRVVVRDRQGKTVAGLHKRDFRLFDENQPQVICHFSVETWSPWAAATAEPGAGRSAAGKARSRLTMPPRQVALFFDDYHLQPANLAVAREATGRYLAKAFHPGDRIGIFSTSGRGNLDFTSDRNKLLQALSDLRGQSRFPKGGYCPDITPYHAQLILDGRENDALSLAVVLTALCQCHCPTTLDTARSTAMIIMIRSELAAESTLTRLDDLVRHLGTMPGQRTVVIVSDGFLRGTYADRLDQVVDRALRLNVTIDSLDARGLGDITSQGEDPVKPGEKLSPLDEAAYQQILQAGYDAEADVLGELASDAAGTFVPYTDNYEEALQRIDPSEVSYLLGFSPSNLKSDARFHKLKITLAPSLRVSVQARRGYFAPPLVANASPVESGPTPP